MLATAWFSSATRCFPKGDVKIAFAEIVGVVDRTMTGGTGASESDVRVKEKSLCSALWALGLRLAMLWFGLMPAPELELLIPCCDDDDDNDDAASCCADRLRR